MSTNTEYIKQLYDEFITLKTQLFGDNIFVVSGENKMWNRYEQLFMFFYPQFQSSEYRNPLKELKNQK